MLDDCSFVKVEELVKDSHAMTTKLLWLHKLLCDLPQFSAVGMKNPPQYFPIAVLLKYQLPQKAYKMKRGSSIKGYLVSIILG